jgi:hypothetical protein
MARRQAAATSWALGWKPNCQRPKSTGWESNPRPRVTRAVSSPLDDQCLSVGPVGIEPTSSGLRDRCITLSATVPCSRRGGSRTLGLELIRLPLLPLSYAPAVRVGPEGIEPTPAGLKVRCAACYTTTLCVAGCIRFNRRACNIVQLLVVPCSSGSPES